MSMTSGGSGAWFLQIDDVAAIQEEREALLPGGDVQHAGLATQRQHFERGLQPKGL